MTNEQQQSPIFCLDKVKKYLYNTIWGIKPLLMSRMIVEFKYTAGRKREVQPEDCLGLVLVWTWTRGSLNVLQLVFGLTYSNLSVYLRFGVRLFVEMFRHDPLARIRIPSAEEIESFKEFFAAQHPLLTDCWATMDGLKLFLQQSVIGHAIW